MSPLVATLVLVLTGAVLLGLLPFASHRSWLLLARRRGLEERAAAESREPLGPEELPRVTVQLPVYDERHVVERLIDAACSLDYPRELLEIQLLDDSDDETTRLAAERCRRWQARGVEIHHIRRPAREGFKAGALAHGAARARGTFFLVLDADFVPTPDLVLRLLPAFRDPEVGMVQARWDHLNRGESWLTRAQAFLLDGHFFYEQGGRYAAGRFFNFNGTAGMWRRSCLEEAGGWQSDTLTEDLDLSYRAQMAGWRFVYLDDVGVPAELPSTPAALETQQRRWAQGGIQTARKILPDLLAGDHRLPVKLEAVVHLCGHLAHPLTVLLALLLLPSAVARRSLGLDAWLVLDLAVFMAATVPFLCFYGAAGRRRGMEWRRIVPGVARTLALGIGLSVPVSRAVLRGLRRRHDPFERTPKRGALARSTYERPGSDLLLRLGLALLMAAYGVGAAVLGYWASLPFIGLFLAGFGLLAVEGLQVSSGARFGQYAGGAAATGGEALPHQESQDRQPEKPPEPGRLRPDPGGLVGVQAEVAEECEAA